jgi:hypothetical protein
MARCGRCGLYSKYPDNHHEKKWDGVCLWYQHRILPGEVFEKRECSDFFEGVPGLTPMDHFDYKVKRDNLGDAYRVAKRSRVIAYVSLALSVFGMILKLVL